MEAVVHRNRNVIASQAEADRIAVRQKVMDSYQDMLSGKGRDYKEFFADLESRYKSKQCIKCKFFRNLMNWMRIKSLQQRGFANVIIESIKYIFILMNHRREYMY